MLQSSPDFATIVWLLPLQDDTIEVKYCCRINAQRLPCKKTKTTFKNQSHHKRQGLPPTPKPAVHCNHCISEDTNMYLHCGKERKTIIDCVRLRTQRLKTHLEQHEKEELPRRNDLRQRSPYLSSGRLESSDLRGHEAGTSMLFMVPQQTLTDKSSAVPLYCIRVPFPSASKLSCQPMMSIGIHNTCT